MAGITTYIAPVSPSFFMKKITGKITNHTVNA